MVRIADGWRWLKKRLAGTNRETWSSYLEKHEYYSDSGEAGSYGKFPRLPYSLTDILASRFSKISNVRAFVCCHGSSAHWFAKNGIPVVIGRACRDKNTYPEITYLPDWKTYSGPQVDLLLIDSHRMMGAGVALLPFLSPRGIVIVSHLGLGSSGMNAENLRAADELRNQLMNQNWKYIRFVNPGPGIGELIADLWYRPDNILNI